MNDIIYTVSAAILSVIGFIAISVIVSFDVAGLTIAKSDAFRKNPRSLITWSLINGLWHAGLLLVYGVVISGILSGIDFSFSFFTTLADLIRSLFSLTWLPDSMVEVANFLKEHSSIGAGVIGIAIIWSTYSAKIVDVPSQDDHTKLPPLAKTVFRIVISFFQLVTWSKKSDEEMGRVIKLNTEAALVAVDMLALALLAKNLGLMPSFIAISVFSIIVFISVSSICFLVGKFSSIEDTDRHKKIPAIIQDGKLWIEADSATGSWWMITLRLMEPWLIFYFSLELISYLIFSSQNHSLGFLFGASLMLYPLVRQHGMPAIVEAVYKTRMQSSSGVTVPIPIPDTKIKWNDLIWLIRIIGKSLLYGLVAYIVLIIVWLLIKPILIEPTFDGLLVTTIALLGLVGLPGSVFNLKTRQKVALSIDWIYENRNALKFTAIAVIIAATAPVFTEISLVSGQKTLEKLPEGCRLFALGFRENHVHAAQVVVLLLWGLILALVIERMPANEDADETAGNRWADYAAARNWTVVSRAVTFILFSSIVAFYLASTLPQMFSAQLERAGKSCPALTAK